MMRGALLIAFLLSGYLTFGQSLDYKISASLHYPFIPSGLLVEGYPGTAKGTYLGVDTEYYDGSFIEETTSTAFNSKAGIKLGSILSFSLNKRLSLETGLKLNLTRFESLSRMTRITHCEGDCGTTVPEAQVAEDDNASDEYATDANGNPILGPDGEPIPMRYSYSADEPQQESAHQREATSYYEFISSTKIANSILYIDIPVTAKYAVWKNLKLEGGFLTSLLVFSDQDIKRTTTEEKVAERQFNKALLALKLAVSHPVGQKVEIEAGYNGYLSNIYKSAPATTNSRYHFFNLGISYKILN